MDTSYRRVKKTLQIGLGVTGASLLVGGIILSPVLVFAPPALIATAVTTAAIRSASNGKWGWTWVASIASVVWVSSAIYYGYLWGLAFDLADANQPVPPVQEYVLNGSLILSLAAFVAILVSAIFSAIGARQLDLRNRIRSDAYTADV